MPRFFLSYPGNPIDGFKTCPTLCPMCNEPVPLETAKTDEDGLAIHEECYLLKVKLKNGSDGAAA